MHAKLQVRQRGRIAVALLSLIAACNGADDPGTDVQAPSELTAEAVGLSTIRVSWKPAAGEEVTGYDLQRRSDLAGAFETIETALPGAGAARASYFDTKVDPNRYYGYRVRAVTRLGGQSAMSNIAGAKTASMPGLLIQTNTNVATATSVDADGYLAIIRGATDTSSVAVGINGERLISPIARGTYSVVLRGLANNCATANLGDTIKVVTVTDQGTQTVATASFSVSCRDPKKASIVTALQTNGDTLDADGVTVTVSGIIRESGTPADERVYFQTRILTGREGAARFDNLRPGDYEVAIGDVESPCVLDSERKKNLQPTALSVDTVRFAITCRKPIAPVDTAGRPFILRQAWSVASAKTGDKVSLLTSLDLRAQAAQHVSGVSATMQFDNAVVRYDSARTTGSFDITTVNRPQPNFLALGATNTGGPGLSGAIQIVRTWFTVLGATGTSVRTSTTITEVLTPQLTLLNTKVRVEDAALTITAGGEGTTNQTPIAVVTAPSTATAGAAVAFSGAGSTDADGTIVSYTWTFGDNTTGSGVGVSHAYTNAGTYTVRLTVTDDRGATGTRDVSIVVSGAPAASGTIAGTVTSPQQGALSGVTVAAASGATATTTANGTYSIAAIAVGTQTLTVSGLPGNCTAPSAQTVTVASGATVTANFSVVCTVSATNGTVSGKVTRVSDGSGIGFARVMLQPTGAIALALVTTGADGSYTVFNVPVGTGGSAGTGSITLSDLPAGCTAPASQTYTGLIANGTVTKNISVACQVATTGTVSGVISRSTGGNASAVQVIVTPTGGTALAPVTTNTTGNYSVLNVPAGTGTIALSALPAGCTNPGPQGYSAVVAGATVTKNAVLTCVAGAHTYPLTGTWGAITNTGPTGRQVTLTLAIDMGAAPGRPDVNGTNADPLSGITINMTYNGAALDWLSRSLLSPDQFDLGIFNEVTPGTPGTTLIGAISSGSGISPTGAIPLVRLTFNIATGFNGSVTPGLIVTEALSALMNVTSSVVVSIPVLTIP